MTYPSLLELGGQQQQPLEEPQFGYSPLSAQPAQLNPLATVAPQQMPQQQAQGPDLATAALMATGQPTSQPSAPSAPSAPAPQQPQHSGGGGGGFFGGLLSDVGKVAGAIGTGVNDVAKVTTDPLIGAVGNLITRAGDVTDIGADVQRGQELSSGSGLPFPLKALVQTATNPLQAAVTGAEVAGAVLGAPETGGLSLGLLAGPAAQFGLMVGLNAASNAVIQHATSIPGFNALSPQQQQGLVMAASVLGAHWTPAALEKLGGAQAISDFMKPTRTAAAAYDQPGIGELANALNQAQAEAQGDTPTPVAPVHNVNEEPGKAPPIPEAEEPKADTTKTGGTGGTPPGGTTRPEQPFEVDPPDQPPPKPGMVGPLALPDFEPQPLNRSQAAMQSMRGVFGQTVYDPVAAPIARWMQTAQRQIASQAAFAESTGLAQIHNAFGDAFRTEAGGTNPSIALGEDGADLVPVAYLARHLPLYENRLTPQQVTAIQYVSQLSTQFNDQLEALGAPGVEQAPDIIPGGVYISRGRPDMEGSENPLPQGGSRWGKANQLRSTRYEDQLAAVAAGEKYPNLGQVIYSTVRNMGMQVVQQHITNYLQAAVDDNGNPLGQTPADRIPQTLKTSYQAVAQQVASLRGRINTAVNAAGANLGKADELDRALDSIVIHVPDNPGQIAKLPGVLGKLQDEAAVMQGAAPEEQYGSPYAGSGIRIKMPVTPEAIVAANHLNAVGDAVQSAVQQFQQYLPPDTDRIAGLETAIRRSGARLDMLRSRGENYARQADDLQAQLANAQSQLDAIKPDYQQAVQAARVTPRDQATIQMSKLNGWTFPDTLAYVINKEITRNAPATGRGAGMVNTLAGASDLMRGLKFAGAVAWMPIHGVIGMANTLGSIVNPFEATNLAFPRAVVASLRSMADGDAQGDAFANVDAGLRAAGLPDLQDATLQGTLHIGRDYEFSTTGGMNRNAGILSKAAAGVQSLPIVKQANRMWTTGTNVLRAEQYAYLVRQTARTGTDVNDADVLSQIGNAANRSTGYSTNRVGGDIGDMLLFAPRLLQSQLELVVKGLQGGVSSMVPGMSADVEQMAAMRDLAHLYGVMTGLSILANSATGTKVPWKNFSDPFDPEFLRFEWNGEHWSLLGPWDTYMRAIVGLTTSGMGAANAIAHANPTDFGANLSNMAFPLRSASSPLVATIWDAMTGTDVMGQKITPGTLLRDLMPMGAENLPGVPGREKLGVEGIAANQIGIKNTPLTPTQRLNEIGQAKYGKSWTKLMPSQQAQIKSEYPEIWQDKVNQMPAETQRYYATKARLQAEQQADDNAFRNGTLARKTWADNFRSRQQQLYGIQQQAFGPTQPVANPKTPSQIYSNIIYANTDQATGGVNWDGVDAMLAQEPPDVQSWVTDQRSLSITPTTAVYQKALAQYRQGASIPTLPGYTGRESGQVIQAYYNALSFAATHYFSTKPDMVVAALSQQQRDLIAGLNGAGLDGQKIANGALLYALGSIPYLPYAKRAFELQHPLIGVFGLGGGAQGALSPQEAAQIKAEQNAA